MTIGVNLGGDLKPVEAGVVSINSEPFLSDNVIDRLMRLDFDEARVSLHSSAVGR